MLRYLALTIILIFSFSLFAQDKNSFSFVKNTDYYRNFLPKTEDAFLKDLFKKNLLFYTKAEMPIAHQDTGGIHSSMNNISAVPTEPFGNPNREFPWGTPAGTHKATNFNSFNFVYLPSAILWEQTTLPRYKVRGRDGRMDEDIIKWEYPNGTVFGEALLIKDNQEYRCFELRTRLKKDGKWNMNLYRPVLSRKELENYLTIFNCNIGKPDIRIERLKNSDHLKTVIDTTSAVDYLPEIPPNIVRKLLDLPFQSALGQEWITKDGIEGYAPSTKTDFNIVPKGYEGAHLQVNSKFCMTCHEGVLKQGDEFDERRDWYGRVRGSDGIFSFHIFEHSCISPKGHQIMPQINQNMTNYGLLKRK